VDVKYLDVPHLYYYSTARRLALSAQSILTCAWSAAPNSSVQPHWSAPTPFRVPTRINWHAPNNAPCKRQVLHLAAPVMSLDMGR